MEKFFNFNNEQALTPIDVDSATGEVSFELDDEVTTFASVQEFAEFYADARNVKPDNLKNWALVEDGDTYSFILRAGSAGVDARDLANTARTLRESGMSPEEVARAMVNMQAEIREQEEAEQAEARREAEERDQLSYRESIIEKAVESRVGSQQEKLLFLAYDVTSTDELRDAIANDPELFEEPVDDEEADEDDNDETYAYNDREWEEEDEWEDEDEDRDDRDVFADNIFRKVEAQKDALNVAYPGVPLAIVLPVVFNEPVADNYREGADEAFTKAKRAASAAGRQVPVTIVVCTDIEAPVVTRTFHNNEGVNVAEGELYMYNRRFILLKDFNPVLPTEKDFDVEVDEAFSEENDIETSEF